MKSFALRIKTNPSSSSGRVKTEPDSGPPSGDRKRNLFIGVTRLKQRANTSRKQKEQISTLVSFYYDSLTRSRHLLENPYSLVHREKNLKIKEQIENLKTQVNESLKFLEEKHKELEELKTQNVAEKRLEKGDSLRKMKLEARMTRAKIQMHLARSQSEKIGKKQEKNYSQ